MNKGQDEFMNDSQQAGELVGKKVKEGIIAVLKPIKEYISDIMNENKEIKQIEKNAYLKQKKKLAYKKGKLRANSEHKEIKDVDSKHEFSITNMKGGLYD